MCIRDSSIHSVSFGPLRFPKEMFKDIFKLYPETPLFSGPLSQQNGVVSYDLKIEEEMNKIDIKLKSENFTQNAPAEIIDEQKNRYKEYVLSKEKIEMAIKSLG